MEISSISQILDLINHPYWLKHGKGRAACPVHGGSNKSSFSFQGEVCFCHSCGFNGNHITLARELEVIGSKEQLSPKYTITTKSQPRPKSLQQEILEVGDEMMEEADNIYVREKNRIQRKSERDGTDAAYYTRLAILDQRYDDRLEQIACNRDNCLSNLGDT